MDLTIRWATNFLIIGEVNAETTNICVIRRTTLLCCDVRRHADPLCYKSNTRERIIQTIITVRAKTAKSTLIGCAIQASFTPRITMGILATRIGSAERTSQVAMTCLNTCITVTAIVQTIAAIHILAITFEPTPIAAHGARAASATKPVNARVAVVARAVIETLLAQIDAHPALHVMRFLTAIVRLGGKAMMHSVPDRQTSSKGYKTCSTTPLFLRAKLP